jgi:hypothetical protein
LSPVDIADPSLYCPRSKSETNQEVLAENHRPWHGPASTPNNFRRRATRFPTFERQTVGITDVLRDATDGSTLRCCDALVRGNNRSGESISRLEECSGVVALFHLLIVDR